MINEGKQIRTEFEIQLNGLDLYLAADESRSERLLCSVVK